MPKFPLPSDIYASSSSHRECPIPQILLSICSGCNLQLILSKHATAQRKEICVSLANGEKNSVKYSRLPPFWMDVAKKGQIHISFTLPTTKFYLHKFMLSICSVCETYNFCCLSTHTHKERRILCFVGWWLKNLRNLELLVSNLTFRGFTDFYVYARLRSRILRVRFW